MQRLDIHAAVLQEYKVSQSFKSPILPNFTTLRVYRVNGGLLAIARIDLPLTNNTTDL